MCSKALEPFYNNILIQSNTKIQHNNNKFKQYIPFSLDYYTFKPIKFVGSSFFCTKSIHSLSFTCFATKSVVSNNKSNDDFTFDKIFPLTITDKVEGKIYIKMDQGKDGDHWQLTIGCSVPGKWLLHWGVHYVDDVGSEWDQPPKEMRPPNSIAIKDYAVETPLKRSSTSVGGEGSRELAIAFNSKCRIDAINFVLKDQETGSWYQHNGRDFVVPLDDYLCDSGNDGTNKGFGLWQGTFGSFSNMLHKGEKTPRKSEDSEESAKVSTQTTHVNRQLEGFYEEQPIIKEVTAHYSLGVSVRKCPDTPNKLVYLETDIPGDVIVHWGVYRDGDRKTWEVPASLHPPDTEVFKNKAMRTRLQAKEDGFGSEGLFTIDKEFIGLPFVLKLNDGTWLNNRGDDFFIPLNRTQLVEETTNETRGSVGTDKKPSEGKQEASRTFFADGIIKEIRNLVTDISSEKSWKTKGKRAQESLLQEIEKLAAEAYSMFRSPPVTSPEETEKESEEKKPEGKISSGTGSGYEILCQGFNWESHKSGRWYMELQEKASELSSLGFTIVWLPPPTESVSPEGYMPKDLYNLNSRYGNIDELKSVVKSFHEVGIEVLGDVVLNHRCAHFQNQNGIWNIFGGRLNWDDRAVVADDPHFQGRGNKSSGDNFHAAPNIDHSQEFVRNDLTEWLCWLRKDIGYDGWRLDYVRGFWGGYVKDYIGETEPYFAVGEYWDSLSYTYGEMDYVQDAHRQRIIDWIGATGGAAGAFDVTTKGILHSVLERCEYWRLSDPNGKPPGVVGWWPSRAVTFIENHDTGSTQGHWRFPGGKEMQGYAYILTHPGTPSVFYDHIYSHYHSDIASLIALRIRKKIHCRSIVKISKAVKEVYAAVIDEKVAMKIGPGHYEPPTGPQSWSVAAEGKDYRVWEAL